MTCIVLLLHKASATDLCTSLNSTLDPKYQRNVVPLGGISVQGLADPFIPTPLACATACCGSLSCNAIFFFNETCYQIECSPDEPSRCTYSSAEDDQYAGSYWLLLRTPPQSLSNSSSSTLTQTLASSLENTVSPTGIPASMTPSFVTPISLGPECNISGTDCGPNEECVSLPSETTVTRYQCACLTGFQRDESTKTCIQLDDGMKELVSPVSTLSASPVVESPNTTMPLPSVQPSSTVLPTVPQGEGLVVSAGEERTIRWPTNEITVNAFVLPQTVETNKDNYRYQWSLFAHPDGTETGEMVDINSASLKLSKLRIGTYTFKVSVSADGKYGESYVNITVLPAARENKSPVAYAKPSYQEVNQPNDLIIDGSGSTDDDKIVRYHWEEVSSPLDSQTSIDTSDLEKPTLVLKGLGPGSYRFKLTVTDSDGLQNDTYANALVIKETDYPPKANAGSNIIINLPQTSVTLMGNASQDDKGIISYEWTKKSDDKLTADMLGVRTPFLQLDNLQVGDYTFTLTVTDSAKQMASADVHVFVKPERNQPPVSRAGPDKVIWLPVDTLTLDGSNSTDDQKILSYTWSLIGGPNVPVITNGDQTVASVSNLVIGEYKFKLTVKDNEDLESSSQIVVTVKENPNRAPVAKAGGDRVVVLPSPLVIINGSASSDDKGIVSYLWTRDKSSPAAGDVVPLSDQQVALQLVNIVPGHYKFTLTVTDAEGMESQDSMSLVVQPDPYRLNLVELHLMIDISSFKDSNESTLKDQLSLLLHKSSSTGVPTVFIRQLAEDIPTGRTLVIFYVESVNKDHRELWPAPEVVSTLKKLRSSLDILEIQIAKFEPVVCQNNCSDHGVCDQVSKMCICDGFWMEDFFKSYFGDQETNCDWSVLYVVIIVFFGVVALGATFWAIVCYCKRYRCSYLKPKLKRHRYSGSLEVQSEDSFKINEQMELIPKTRPIQNSSLMQSESELSSEELLFVNSKRTANGFAKKLNNNGSAVSGAKQTAA